MDISTNVSWKTTRLSRVNICGDPSTSNLSHSVSGSHGPFDRTDSDYVDTNAKVASLLTRVPMLLVLQFLGFPYSWVWALA